MNGLQNKPLAVAARITATFTGAAIDLRPYEGQAMIHLNSAAMENAASTMDAKIQHSVDGATAWTDAVTLPSGAALAFAQVTNAAASAQTIEFNTTDTHRYIRVVETLAGTTPAVTAAISMTAKLQSV